MDSSYDPRRGNASMIALQDIVIIYDWPGESHVSFDLETRRYSIRIAVNESDPGGVVQRGMDAIKRRGWAAT